MPGFYDIKPLEWRVFCNRSGNMEALSPFGKYVLQYEVDPEKEDKEHFPWKLYYPSSKDVDEAFADASSAHYAAEAHLKKTLHGWIMSPDVLSTGAAAITAERERQIVREGWDASHDDRYKADELVKAAAGYLLFGIMTGAAFRKLWPWTWGWFKPGPRKRELEKAGALIAAEWDRLDRLEEKTLAAPSTPVAAPKPVASPSSLVEAAKPIAYRYFKTANPRVKHVVDAAKYNPAGVNFWVSKELMEEHTIEPLYTLDQARVILELEKANG